MVRGIGVNVEEEYIDGDAGRLSSALERSVEAGYDAVELNLGALNAVRDGRIASATVRQVRDVLDCYPLRYTMHGPNALNLARHPERDGEVLASCLEVSAELGAEVYVYHSGQIALHDAAAGRTPPPPAVRLRALWARETEALTRFAARAEALGLTLAIENRDPHLWEVAALERWGRDGGSLLGYHQGMRLDLLAEQARQIGSPAVGICLDVGHAFLAAPYWQGADYIAGVRQAAPWVRHVHLHDNYGRLDDVPESLAERLVFGQADNHMPPGWGRIPLRETLSALGAAGYGGWLTLELRPRYKALLPEALAATRRLLEGL